MQGVMLTLLIIPNFLEFSSPALSEEVWQGLVDRLPIGDEDAKRRRAIFKSFDTNGNGYLTFTEFLANLFKYRPPCE